MNSLYIFLRWIDDHFSFFSNFELTSNILIIIFSLITIFIYSTFINDNTKLHFKHLQKYPDALIWKYVVLLSVYFKTLCLNIDTLIVSYERYSTCLSRILFIDCTILYVKLITFQGLYDILSTNIQRKLGNYSCMYPVMAYVKKLYSQLIKLLLINCIHIGFGIGLQTFLVLGFGLRPF